MKYIATFSALITLLLISGSKPLLAQESQQTSPLSIIYDWDSRPEMLAMSNDGRLVAHFIFSRGVFVRNLETGKDIKADGPWNSDYGTIVFSPDGNSLIFTEAGGGARMMSPELFMKKLGDPNPVNAILAPSETPAVQYPPDLHNPMFSPDGSLIAVQVVPRLKSGQQKSYVGLLSADAIKQNPKRVVEGTPVFWSTDGKSIFFENKDGAFSRFNIRTMRTVQFDVPGEILGKVPGVDAAFVKSGKSVTIFYLHENNRPNNISADSELVEAVKSVPVADNEETALKSIQAVGSRKLVLIYGEHVQLVSWGPVDPQEIARGQKQHAQDQERLGHWTLEHLSACIKIVDGTLDHYIHFEDGSDLGLPALLPHYNFYGRFDENGKLVIEPIVHHIDAPDEPILTPEELANTNLPTKEEARLIHVRHEALGHSGCEKSTVRILSGAKSTLTPIVVDLLNGNDSVSLKLLARQITWADAAKERQAIVADYKSKLDAAWMKIRQGSDSYKIVEPDQTQMIDEANKKYDAMEGQWANSWKAFETTK